MKFEKAALTSDGVRVRVRGSGATLTSEGVRVRVRGVRGHSHQ